MPKPNKTPSASTLMRRARMATPRKAALLRAEAAKMRMVERQNKLDKLSRLRLESRIPGGGDMTEFKSTITPAEIDQMVKEAYQRGHGQGKTEARIEARNKSVAKFIRFMDSMPSEDTCVHMPADDARDIVEALWAAGYGPDGKAPVT